MCKINKLSLYIFLLFFACVKSPEKKPDSQEMLEKGSKLFAKYGCAVCHSLEGNVIYGPSLNEIYMKKIKVIRQGKEYEVVADRDYLKKAISEPRYEKVLEYNNKEMPLSNFSEEEVEILVDYLIAIQEKNDPAE